MASTDAFTRPASAIQEEKDAGTAARMAALIAAKEQAEAANLAKTRLLASASHDLRQPLNAMSLLLGVLRNRTADPEVLPIADQLQQSLDTMMELFNAMLDLSKVEATGEPVTRTAVRLDPLLHRIAIDFAGPARAKGLDLRLVESRRSVLSDAMLLERLLRNLVSNAIRYTPSGGRVLVGARPRGGEVRLDVVDTGPGIPPDQREQIFEEFRQAGAGRRPRPEGHGLGLAIVRHAAELLDARLDVASTPGRGTRFSVTVPPSVDPHAALRALSLPPAMTTPAAAAGACRVLVVEDDPMVAIAMRMVLEEFGCTVIVTGSADEAVRAVPSSGPPLRLILADYRLPGGRDGIEAIHQVRSAMDRTAPGRSPLAGVITGDLASGVQSRAAAIGARCLLKPIRPDELRALVTAAEAG